MGHAWQEIFLGNSFSQMKMECHFLIFMHKKVNIRKKRANPVYIVNVAPILAKREWSCARRRYPVVVNFPEVLTGLFFKRLNRI